MKTSFPAFIFRKYEKSHLWLLLCNNESRRNSSSSSSNIIVQNRLSSTWRLVYSIILCYSDFFPFQSNYFENCANPKLIMNQIYISVIYTMGEIFINGFKFYRVRLEDVDGKKITLWSDCMYPTYYQWIFAVAKWLARQFSNRIIESLARAHIYCVNF